MCAMFVDSVICYKQKCKALGLSFNLGYFVNILYDLWSVFCWFARLGRLRLLIITYLLQNVVWWRERLYWLEIDSDIRNRVGSTTWKVAWNRLVFKNGCSMAASTLTTETSWRWVFCQTTGLSKCVKCVIVKTQSRSIDCPPSRTCITPLVYITTELPVTEMPIC